MGVVGAMGVMDNVGVSKSVRLIWLCPFFDLSLHIINHIFHHLSYNQLRLNIMKHHLIARSLRMAVFALSLFVMDTVSAHLLPVNISQATTSYDLTTLRSWGATEQHGDVNRDGIDDIVMIATPHFQEMMIVNELGDTVDTNKPVFSVFFGNGHGGYSCRFQSDSVLPARDDAYHFLDFGLEVNDKGVFSISIGHFSSVGGWGNTNEKYVFRYQNDDFYLIGEDNDYFMRNSGEGERTSINYLTHRKQVVKYNAFDDSVKPKEKWTRIPNQPLRRLGTWTLGE